MGRWCTCLFIVVALFLVGLWHVFAFRFACGLCVGLLRIGLDLVLHAYGVDVLEG